eukprot:815067-Prymnesium_polylepis.1
MALSIPGGLDTALTSQRRSRFAVMALGAISLSGHHVRLVRAATSAKIPSATPSRREPCRPDETFSGSSEPYQAYLIRIEPSAQPFMLLAPACAMR